MENNEKHITPYSLFVKVLIVLLILTTLSVLITEMHFGALSVVAALTIASIKVSLVLIFFMHLKWEKTFLRVMVGGVFILYALIIIFTFIDYLLR
jgi:cytochrome c oxidase subunit 4